MTEHDQESKNKRIAALSTAAIQVLVVFLLFIIVAWRAPNPPLPEYGIELNFGLDTEGSGDVQPETPAGNEGNEPEEATQEEQPQPEPEVNQEEVKEEVKPTETKQAVEEQPVSKEESPVVVKEKKEPEPPKEKIKEKVEEKKVEKQPEVVKPKADPNATYKPANEQATAEKDANKEGTPGNHGDDKGKTGDKGNPEGKLDAKALYGTPGGGGGGVSMSGFNGFDWPSVQTPSLPDGAFGVYEFVVKVDDQGEVVDVKAVQRGLSLEAEQRLKAMIQKLEFVPKGSNLPPVSEGRITFKVVSR